MADKESGEVLSDFEHRAVVAIEQGNSQALYLMLQQDADLMSRVSINQQEKVKLLEDAAKQEDINPDMIEMLLKAGAPVSPQLGQKIADRLHRSLKIPSAVELRIYPLLNIKKLPLDVEKEWQLLVNEMEAQEQQKRDQKDKQDEDPVTRLLSQESKTPPPLPLRREGPAFFKPRRFRTDLHGAADAGDIALLKSWLVLRSNVVNQQDEEGNTALHLAARRNFKLGIEVLLAANADKELENDNGEIPLDLAAAGGFYRSDGAFVALGGVLQKEEARPQKPLPPTSDRRAPLGQPQPQQLEPLASDVDEERPDVAASV